MQIFDIEKCFDALWLKECINDVYDKLPVLYLENCNAEVAVKTSNGALERVSIKNIIMQGSIWGNLIFTTTMDKFEVV